VCSLRVGIIERDGWTHAPLGQVVIQEMGETWAKNRHKLIIDELRTVLQFHSKSCDFVDSQSTVDHSHGFPCVNQWTRHA